MIIVRNKGALVKVLAVALLLGAAMGETSNFINYYFGKHISDSIILLALASTSFLAAASLNKRLDSFYVIFTLLSLHIIVGMNYSYRLYQLTEWVSTGLYAVIILFAFGAGWQSQIHTSNKSIFLFAMVLGFTLVASGVNSIIVLTVVIIASIIFQLIFKGSKRATLYFLVLTPVTTMLLLVVEPPASFERQSKYYDPLVFSKETPYQTIDITSWKGNEWFYYNNINQFSSIDHWLYFEPMAHVASQMVESRKKVLIIGGENGLLAHQLLKYPDLESLDVVPIDIQLYHLATEVGYFTRLNQQFFRDKRVNLLNTSTFDYLASVSDDYDLIFIDVPDPVDIELNQYYTVEFYRLCHEALNKNGILVTQAGSPYFATRAFNIIENSISACGFTSLPIHNQILTLGEWGWVLGFKGRSSAEVSFALTNTTFDEVPTTWLNKEAVDMMTAFGKPTIKSDTLVNSLKQPIVHEFYTRGTWKFQ